MRGKVFWVPFTIAYFDLDFCAFCDVLPCGLHSGFLRESSVSVMNHLQNIVIIYSTYKIILWHIVHIVPLLVPQQYKNGGKSVLVVCLPDSSRTKQTNQV